MNFELTEEQRMVQEMARNFSQQRVLPLAAELDQAGRFPQELVREMAQLGLMGMMVPAEYGGSGLETLSYVLALEEVARGCASTAVIMSVNNSLVAGPILHFGTEEQKKRYLVPIARGEKIGCYCLSEPNAGSDSANQQTSAVLQGDKWVLNGTKNFITNGKEAHTAIVFASNDREKRHRGITAFIVDTENPGWKITKLEKKLGINASSTAQIVLEDCQVPKENVLGEVGGGFKVAMHTLDGGRIGIATQALGIARAALEESIQYAKQREAFGQPIASLQAIQFMIADMATRIDAARLLVWRAASLKDKGLRMSKEASMAKLFASETAMWVTTKAIQVHGGYGYIKDYPVERHFRDAKITEIYEGTSEIQRLVIAKWALSD
jgi:butyryl-CoA dehydrogenase